MILTLLKIESNNCWRYLFYNQFYIRHCKQTENQEFFSLFLFLCMYLHLFSTVLHLCQNTEKGTYIELKYQV